jgi:hypothetical protein
VGARSASRQAIGQWLRDNTHENAVIAMEGIGYQGTYSNRKIIDLAGLVSPEIVRISKECATNGEFYYRAFQELRPDFIVLRHTEITKSKHFFGGPTFDNDSQREYFFENCEQLESFTGPSSWEPAARLLVFGRRK